MKPLKTAVLLLALSALPVCVRGAAAQATPQPPAVQVPPPSPAEIQAWFDALVLVQAQRALDISDAQYPQFVGRVKALQDTRRRNQRQRLQLVQEIQRLLNGKTGPPDDAVLRERMKALDDLQDKGAAEVRRAYENLDQILDVRQQARFRVFEEQIERRKFEILLNARRARAAMRQSGR